LCVPRVRNIYLNLFILVYMVKRKNINAMKPINAAIHPSVSDSASAHATIMKRIANKSRGSNARNPMVKSVIILFVVFSGFRRLTFAVYLPIVVGLAQLRCRLTVSVAIPKIQYVTRLVLSSIYLSSLVSYFIRSL